MGRWPHSARDAECEDLKAALGGAHVQSHGRGWEPPHQTASSCGRTLADRSKFDGAVVEIPQMEAGGVAALSACLQVLPMVEAHGMASITLEPASASSDRWSLVRGGPRAFRWPCGISLARLPRTH